MVLLLEYEGKRLFEAYGIPVPTHHLVKGIRDIRSIRTASVIKAQVPTGGRGKLGGVVAVRTVRAAKAALEKIKTIDFNGFHSKYFLIEEEIRRQVELYISITLDRSKRSAVLIVSKKGGINIEEVPATLISTYEVNQLIGLPEYIKRNAFDRLEPPEKFRDQFYHILDALWHLYVSEDAELVEINPLAVTANGLVALDSKVVVEDDSLFRHPNVKAQVSGDEIERKASAMGISFVRLSGDIGLIANGAGLTMATIDQISTNGGKPGDFLDLGGTDDPARVYDAFSIVALSKPRVLLVNIFGGVTKCDTVAMGIVRAIDKFRPVFPVVVRLSGFNEEKGVELLKARNITAFREMNVAVTEAIRLSV
jgi:succinyl-CoA synthetase beta subunit